MGLQSFLADRSHRLRGHDRMRDPDAFVEPLRGGHGLEVGGPSAVFRTGDRLPAYAALARVDGVQFSADTHWHGHMGEGVFDPGEPGRQGELHIREGSDLSPIASASLDAVLSSHVVEHFANPLGALREWMRVLRPGGHLLLVAPHKDGTFDHRREVTPLAHLIEDDERATREDDTTHIEEFLANHDASRNPPAAADPAGFEANVRDNLTHRLVHHHVFDTAAIVRVLDHLGLEVRAVEARWPHDIFALARKPETGTPDNAAWLAPDAAWRRASPFQSDRALADR